MTAELPENARQVLQHIIDTADIGAAYHSPSPYENIGFKNASLATVTDLVKSLLTHPGQPLGVHLEASWHAADRRSDAKAGKTAAALRRSLRKAMQP